MCVQRFVCQFLIDQTLLSARHSFEGHVTELVYINIQKRFPYSNYQTNGIPYTHDSFLAAMHHAPSFFAFLGIDNLPLFFFYYKRVFVFILLMFTHLITKTVDIEEVRMHNSYMYLFIRLLLNRSSIHFLAKQLTRINFYNLDLEWEKREHHNKSPAPWRE
jgi:hypothetical protein